MKITIAQIMAANEVMTHLNELKPKPSLILTLEQAALFMAGSATMPVVNRVTLNAVRRVAG